MPAHKLASRIEFQGLPISLEHNKGGVRKWYDPAADEHGTTKMKVPYGYIRGTLGTDGDEVDVFVGDNKNSSKVFIITQLKAPEFTEIDEQKCMLGFSSASAAKKTYLDHYNTHKFFGDIKEVDIDVFKEKLISQKGELIKSLKLWYTITSGDNKNMTLKFEPNALSLMKLRILSKSMQLDTDDDKCFVAPKKDVLKCFEEFSENIEKALTARTASNLMGARGRYSTFRMHAPVAVQAPQEVLAVTPVDPFRVVVNTASPGEGEFRKGTLYKSGNCGHIMDEEEDLCKICKSNHDMVNPGPFWD